MSRRCVAQQGFGRCTRNEGHTGAHYWEEDEADNLRVKIEELKIRILKLEEFTGVPTHD
jgi:hypothetical protein